METFECGGLNLLVGDMTAEYVNGLSEDERRERIKAHKRIMKWTKKRYTPYAKRDVITAELLKRQLSYIEATIAIYQHPCEQTEQALCDAENRLDTVRTASRLDLESR